MNNVFWNSNYELLLQYLEEHEGKFPNSNELYLYVNLGNWVSRQRTIYNNGEKRKDGSIKYNTYVLTKEQIDKLNSINFMWCINKKNVYINIWNERFELLKEYLKEHNGRYPTSTEKYKGINLVNWVNTQRTIYNNGEKQKDGSIRYRAAILTKEQIEKLNEINFAWCSIVYTLAWEEKYELLKKYLKEHDGKHPSQSTYYKKNALGVWVNTQRIVYYNGIKDEMGTLKYGDSAITKEQIEKLDAIGFIWAPLSKKEYRSVILNEKMSRLIKRKILYKLRLTLELSKNDIESKEDIKKIEKEFIKQLTLFD